MRTRTTPPAGQVCAASARWAWAAAARASVARAKTTKKLSPWVSISSPLWAVQAARSKRWWSASTAE